jgi:hypothetical protein
MGSWIFLRSLGQEFSLPGKTRPYFLKLLLVIVAGRWSGRGRSTSARTRSGWRSPGNHLSPFIRVFMHPLPMPEVSRFLGISIRFYYREHAPPHFHAVYGEHEAQIAIGSYTVLEGKLPGRVLGLV